MPIYSKEYILDFLQGYVQGYDRGNYYLGNCPFHNDSKPSFAVYYSGGAKWVCYAGCGEGSFGQLKTKLQELFALPVTPVQKEVDTEKEWKIEPVNAIPQWFLDRGFTVDMCQRWGLQMDQISGGVIIPCYNRRHEEVGCIVRRYGMKPKYKYSPGFPRSGYLFPENVLQDYTTLYLVEGQLDALWGIEAGLSCLAIGGNTIRPEQLLTLSQLPIETIVISFDNPEIDSVGKQDYVNMGVVLYEKLLSLGVRLKYFQWDNVKDFQEYKLQDLAAKK